MILLIDIGNTCIKSALWDGALRVDEPVVHHDKPLELFAQRSWPAVSAVWMSLVPRMNDVSGWTAVVQQKLGVTPQIACSQAHWNGLRSSYAQPEKLGVDRWLTMVALWNEYRQPFCVISAGTAMTFDRVDALGQHLGGVIAPGFGSMQKNLLDVTRATHDEMSQRYDDQLGRDSMSAIRQGAFFAAMGVIERALRAPGAVPSERRIITGGDAPALICHLPGGIEHRAHLVLHGLLALAQSSHRT